MKREITKEEAMGGMKVLTNVKGTPVTTFEGQRDSAVQLIRNNVNIGDRKINPDGSVAKSRVVNAAINEDVFYNNRYRLYEDKIEIISTHTTDGWRVIDEVERSGRVPYRQIDVAVIERDGSALKMTGHKRVSDTEFIADFTHKLNKEAMREILPVIFNTPEATGEDKLPI